MAKVKGYEYCKSATQWVQINIYPTFLKSVLCNMYESVRQIKLVIQIKSSLLLSPMVIKMRLGSVQS